MKKLSSEPNSFNNDALKDIFDKECQAFIDLNSTQKRFVYALEVLHQTQAQAFNYARQNEKPNKAGLTRWLNDKGIQAARIEVRQALFYSDNLPIHQYRKRLLRIADANEEKSPSASIQALALLAKLEGKIVTDKSHSAGITVVVNTGIERGKVIEHESS